MRKNGCGKKTGGRYYQKQIIHPGLAPKQEKHNGHKQPLRPYLYVHKGVTQNFLELFRAHYNLRTRRWGRHKGTSAHQCLTGTPVTDWLSLLGFPPSRRLH